MKFYPESLIILSVPVWVLSVRACMCVCSCTLLKMCVFSIYYSCTFICYLIHVQNKLILLSFVSRLLFFFPNVYFCSEAHHLWGAPKKKQVQGHVTKNDAFVTCTVRMSGNRKYDSDYLKLVFSWTEVGHLFVHQHQIIRKINRIFFVYFCNLKNSRIFPLENPRYI